MSSLSTKHLTPLWPCHKAEYGNPSSLVSRHSHKGIRNGIAAVQKQLFTQDGTVEILACRWIKKEKLRRSPIFSVDNLNAYLNTWHTEQPSINPTTHFFLIDQANTKSCLDTTDQAMYTLLDRINAFPELGYALPAFAGGDAPVFEGRSDFYARTSTDQINGSLTSELCLLLKYVELNGNKASTIPWSIRQQLIYQKFDPNINRESIMLLRASTTLNTRVLEAFGPSSEHALHWTNIVVLAISTLPDNWAEYAKFLDLAVWDVEKAASFTNPVLQSLGEANFKTLLKTRMCHDLLTRAIHVLKSNIRVQNVLSTESEKRRGLENGEHSEQYQLLEATIQATKYQLDTIIRHLELIQARLTRITAGIRDCIALRSSHQTANEAKNMRQLALSANKEARTVKAIALVTLVYLPATFVATFLSMDYVHVTGTEKGGILHVTVQPTLWMFMALAVPLTLATLMAWWVWECWRRKKRKDGALSEPDQVV